MGQCVGKGEVIYTLDEMRPGQSARVVEIRSQDGDRLMKLSTFGLAPGCVIRLQQRLPAYIIWVGETQLSLDRQIACEISLRSL